MKRKLFITLITTVIGLVIIFAGYASIFLFDRVAAPIKYDAQLSDFDWPNGAGIVFIRTASNSYEVGVEPGYHIASTDGKITKHIQSNDPYALEVLSPTELLIAEHEELFFITPESIDSITTQREEISFISLSPKKEYLKSGFDEETCIATFDFVTVGECTNPTNTILDVIDWETHYADGEWDASENTYIMRIRSTEIHDEVPADHENAPPKRVQREVARYAYNAETNTIETLDLDSEIDLKGKNAFLTDENRTDPIAASGYKTVGDEGGHSIGIEQISTGKQARLMDAPYFGDMPGF